jgi:PEP-CTERM motif
MLSNTLVARRVMRASQALAVCSLSLIAPLAAVHAQTVFAASGTDATAITGAVNAFRNAIGGGNIAGPGALFGGVRREINWDGVPDGISSPNAFPGNGFNARGVQFNTPGTGFQNSSSAASGVPVRFGNIDASYTNTFATFSAQKLFTPIGSNIMDVVFQLPNTTTAASTTAFGAVFSDVDLANTTSLEFFDLLNNSMGLYYVPNTVGSGTLSFLGVQFAGPQQISRVRITAGNVALGAGVTDQNGDRRDVVVMDDFIYGEPAAVVPEPATIVLMASGLVMLGVVGRRRTRRQALDA